MAVKKKKKQKKKNSGLPITLLFLRGFFILCVCVGFAMFHAGLFFSLLQENYMTGMWAFLTGALFGLKAKFLMDIEFGPAEESPKEEEEKRSRIGF